MIVSLLVAVATQTGGENLGGYWANGSGSVIVSMQPCADEGWCGKVQWASEEAQADAARHGTATLVGIELLHGFVPVEAGRWKGRLFIPDLNKRARAELQRIDDNRLRVRGCTVGGLICKSQIWTRSASR